MSLVAGLSLVSVSCASQFAQRRVAGVPDKAPTEGLPPDTRGADSAAAAVSPEEQLQIYRALVRDFYRPTRRQARWIDPRVLPNRRTRAADSGATPDPEFASAIVEAVGLSRVCRADEKSSPCDGLQGGVLRFSTTYATGPDSAVVYAQYSAVLKGHVAEAAPGYEQEFQMARDDHGWRIIGRRTVASPGGSAAGRNSTCSAPDATCRDGPSRS